MEREDRNGNVLRFNEYHDEKGKDKKRVVITTLHYDE